MFNSSIQTIEQFKDILSQLSQEYYVMPCNALSDATIGQHTRHVIELYQCLINGYDAAEVSYDKRKRDKRIQEDIDFAILQLSNVQLELEKPNKEIQVYYDLGEKEVGLQSNYFREVMYNLEHAIHHHALIKVGIKTLTTIELPEFFGVAPSTIQFEHVSRPSAFVPKEEVINNQKIIFPQDPKAGGTWFAISERGVVAVLLNGAFKKHISKGNYAKSRGLIVLDIISNQNPHNYLNTIGLFNIEPFTILVFQERKLVELRWNGEEKFIRNLDNTKSHIWSSATLYDQDAIAKRGNLFSNFINKNEAAINTASIIDFHSNNNEDSENGFVINRETGLKTFSVTQAVLKKEKITLKHIDLLKEETNTIEIGTNQLMNHFE